jgi:hypothetical protein
MKCLTTLLFLTLPVLNAANVLDYGAVGDVLSINDAEMTINSTTFTPQVDYSHLTQLERLSACKALAFLEWALNP